MIFRLGLLLLVPISANACPQATVYSAKYEGRKMANGEIYHHNAITAASPDRRLLGKRVLVIHDGRRLVVRITDTMPRRNKCVALDLSGAAARALGIKDIGRVRIKEIH